MPLLYGAISKKVTKVTILLFSEEGFLEEKGKTKNGCEN